jgi:hypothetical protein
MLLPLLLGVVLNLTWNQTSFSTSLPVSGQIKAYQSRQALAELFALPPTEALWQFFQNLVSLPQNEIVTLLFDRLAVVLSWGINRLTGASIPDWPFRVGVGIVFSILLIVARKHIAFALTRMEIWPLFSGAILTFLIYKTYYYKNWMPWYFAIGDILTPFLAAALYDFVASKLVHWKAFPLARLPKHMVTRCFAMVVTLFLIGNSMAMIGWRLYQARNYKRYGHQISVARWIRENLPTDSTIGTWNAGLVGYFSAYPVVNLDGLVNSPEYMNDYLLQGRTLDFVQSEEIEYIIDYVHTYDLKSPPQRLTDPAWLEV